MRMFGRNLIVLDEKTTLAESLSSIPLESPKKCVKYRENEIQKLLKLWYI